MNPESVTRGCRYMMGREAEMFRKTTNSIIEVIKDHGYTEFIPSILSSQSVFVEKAGNEILGQMYTFDDKGDRKICLIPEVTAVCQNIYKNEWINNRKKPVKIYYLTRCYRYERPQKGRYREFWQLGVECMGDDATAIEMAKFLKESLESSGLEDFTINSNVKRGLGYYTEDGFEAEVGRLGSQKQVAGGGRYDCGIGWAIGIDRLMLGIYGDDIIGAK